VVRFHGENAALLLSELRLKLAGVHQRLPLFGRVLAQIAKGLPHHPLPVLREGIMNLGTWLQRHGNLPPEQQERALQSEPGFNRLPPETQLCLLAVFKSGVQTLRCRPG
jgi:hypothetical protein